MLSISGHLKSILIDLGPNLPRILIDIVLHHPLNKNATTSTAAVTAAVTAAALHNKMTQTNSSPPFPSTVPTAPLLRLSLSKLLAHDPTETARLLQASEEIGFFYLDLSDSETGQSLQHDADNLFTVGEQVFDLDLEEKQKYDFSQQKSYFGYKGQGAAIVDKKGRVDRNEFYNVSPGPTGL